MKTSNRSKEAPAIRRDMLSYLESQGYDTSREGFGDPIPSNGWRAISLLARGELLEGEALCQRLRNQDLADDILVAFLLA